MKAALNRLMSDMVSRIPGAFNYRTIKKLIIALGMRPSAGLCDLKRYHARIISQEDIASFQKVLLIRKGYYDYEYFNICFLNNVLSLCLKAVCEGFLPRIQILNSQGNNIWEMFFSQPFPEIPTDGKRIVPFDQQILEAFPQWNDIYNPDMKALWGDLYRSIPILNPKSKTYAEREASSLLTGRKVLGVLCRGTDYTATHPKGHPVQPTPSEIQKKVREIFSAGSYEYVYLATEDSEYDQLFRDEYGDHLLINQREYYDQAFSSQKLSLIRDVHFDRPDDDYLKGLEYISSLLILSQCDGLVAGNCGGTQAAVFWNGNRYEDLFVFDLGIY